jgi:hypothetical protein
VAAAIKAQGIKLSLDHIFGSPGETEEDLRASLELYQAVKPDRMLTFWLTYYPRTRIIEIARGLGVLTPADIEAIEAGRGPSYYDRGFVNSEMVPRCLSYEALFHLRTLVQNDRGYAIISRILARWPWPGPLVKLIIFLNAVKNRDMKFFYILKCLFAKKHVP